MYKTRVTGNSFASLLCAFSETYLSIDCFPDMCCQVATPVCVSVLQDRLPELQTLSLRPRSPPDSEWTAVECLFKFEELDDHSLFYSVADEPNLDF